MEEEIIDIKSYSSRNADKFVVRLPQGMRQRIADVAKNYHRSMNSEIVSRLESSLRGELRIQEDDLIDAGKTIMLELSSQEHAIIEQVRRLPEGKREALMELLAAI